MGAWVYSYNAFGELVSQTDSLGQTTTMAYDALGRLIQRTERDLVSRWSYDKKIDGTNCGKGIGKLCEAIADNGYKRVHSYDNLGRPSNTATTLDNSQSPAQVSVSYDPTTGRITSKTWPSGYTNCQVAQHGHSAYEISVKPKTTPASRSKNLGHVPSV